MAVEGGFRTSVGWDYDKARRVSTVDSRWLRKIGINAFSTDHGNYGDDASCPASSADGSSLLGLGGEPKCSSPRGLEFERQLYPHNCEDYRHYCESDWDDLFQH